MVLGLSQYVNVYRCECGMCRVGRWTRYTPGHNSVDRYAAIACTLCICQSQFVTCQRKGNENNCLAYQTMNLVRDLEQSWAAASKSVWNLNGVRGRIQLDKIIFTDRNSTRCRDLQLLISSRRLWGLTLPNALPSSIDGWCGRSSKRREALERAVESHCRVFIVEKVVDGS